MALAYYTSNIQTIKFKNNKISEIDNYCLSLYENNVIKDNTKLNEIDNCLNKINSIKYDIEKYDALKNELYESKKYILFKNETNKYYDDGIIIADITKNNINKLIELSEDLNNNYKKLSQEKINLMTSEYEYIQKTTQSVDKLFDSTNKVKDNISINDYNTSKELVDNLKQEDLKQELLKSLGIVHETLDKRQQEIDNAWVELIVPYINQNKERVYNGCEAATLLMGLKYKGYLKDTNLVTFAEQMPKSDDPNKGFYLDIFGLEPKNIAHWIAPEPLTKFGIEVSGNSNIINSTGWSMEQLDNEILKGNPVIIYLTANFKNPYNWQNGVPNNLHVLLLTGYNKKTKEHIIVDPGGYGYQYKYTLSNLEISNLYNLVGKKSVVIR